MSEWSLAALAAGSWSPSQRLRRPPSWFGGAAAELVPLGELARTSATVSPLPAELPLVTPRDVNPTTGAVEPASLADGRDGLRLGEDLRLGDVLLPRRGFGPAVLVDDDHIGLGFSGFLLLRATSEVDPHTLWALLTSRSGLAARRALETGASAVTADSLRQLLVPRFPSQIGARVRIIRAAALDRSALSSLDRTSHWRVVALRDEDPWRRRLEREQTGEGEPLGNLGELWAGRVDQRSCFGVTGAHRAPVLTPRDLAASQPSSLWAEGARTTTESTIALASFEPFRAMQPPPGHALANGLLAIDVRAAVGETAPPSVARALARFFATLTGRQRLQAYATGTTTRRLTLSALGNVRVSAEEVLAAASADEDEDLAERLESAFREALRA